MFTIYCIIMNFCSFKPLMGTGSKKLLNMQTANYGADFVNWLALQFGRFTVEQAIFAKPQHASCFSFHITQKSNCPVFSTSTCF